MIIKKCSHLTQREIRCPTSLVSKRFHPYYLYNNRMRYIVEKKQRFRAQWEAEESSDVIIRVIIKADSQKVF